MKKIFFIVLVVLILPWLLSAAGEKESTTSAEPLMISIMHDDPSTQPFNPQWLIIQEIERRRNVELDVMAVPTSDYKNKRNILLSAGDMPDIITKTWPNDIRSFVSSGVLLAVSDYTDQMPNYTKLIEDWNLKKEIDEFVREGDGKYYIFPGFIEEISDTNGLGIRKDIFEKHDLGIPQTYEELLNNLITLKQLYPDAYGLSDKFKGNKLLSYLCGSFGTSAGWSLEQGFLYDRESDTWVHAPTTPEYKSMLEFLNRMVEAGVLDIETFSQTPQALRQKIFNGNVFVSMMNWTQKGEYETETKKASGLEAEWEVILPPAGPKGIRSYKSNNRINGGVILSSELADDARFDEYLLFTDWLYYSKEGRILGNWGVEGITFTVDEKGNRQLMDSIFNWDNPEAPKYLGRDFGVGMKTFCIVTESDKKYDELSPQVADYLQKLAKNNMTTLSNPNLPANEEDAEMINLGASPLKDYTQQMTLSFILGSEDIDTKWENYVEETIKKKRDELSNIINRVWQNRTK